MNYDVKFTDFFQKPVAVKATIFSIFTRKIYYYAITN